MQQEKALSCSLPTGSAGPGRHTGDSCSFYSHNQSDKFMNLDHIVVLSGPCPEGPCKVYAELGNVGNEGLS